MTSDLRSHSCETYPAVRPRTAGQVSSEKRRSPRRELLGCAAGLWFVLLGALIAADVRAQTPVTGTYTSSPQRLEAKVAAWGADCGPRPQSQTFDERVTVKVIVPAASLTETSDTETSGLAVPLGGRVWPPLSVPGVAAPATTQVPPGGPEVRAIDVPFTSPGS